MYKNVNRNYDSRITAGSDAHRGHKLGKFFTSWPHTDSTIRTLIRRERLIPTSEDNFFLLLFVYNKVLANVLRKSGLQKKKVIVGDIE